MAVAHGPALRVVRALGPHDLVDLGLDDLAQHAEPDADRGRQQPFLRGAGELAQRLLNPLRQIARRLRSVATSGPIRSSSRRFLLSSVD